MSLAEEIMEFAETEESIPEEGDGRNQAQEALKQYHAPAEKKPESITIGKTVLSKLNELKKELDSVNKKNKELEEQVKIARYYADNHERKNIINDTKEIEKEILSTPELAAYFKPEEIYPAIAQEASKSEGARILSPEEMLFKKYAKQWAKELYELKKQKEDENAMYNTSIGGIDYSKNPIPDEFKNAKTIEDVYKIMVG